MSEVVFEVPMYPEMPPYGEVVYPPIEAPPLAEPVTQEEIERYKVYTVEGTVTVVLTNKFSYQHSGVIAFTDSIESITIDEGATVRPMQMFGLPPFGGEIIPMPFLQ